VGIDTGESMGRRFPGVLEPDERLLGMLEGLLDSWLALTDRRLLAWRGNGVAMPLRLSAIERVLIDVSLAGRRADLFVLPRRASQVALHHAIRPDQLEAALAFIETVGDAAGAVLENTGREAVVRIAFTQVEPRSGAPGCR
jgi:hypothetical protein